MNIRRYNLVKNKKKKFRIKCIIIAILIAIICFSFASGMWFIFWNKTNLDVLYFIAGWVPGIAIVLSMIVLLVIEFLDKERKRINKQIRILIK